MCVCVCLTFNLEFLFSEDTVFVMTSQDIVDGLKVKSHVIFDSMSLYLITLVSQLVAFKIWELHFNIIIFIFKIGVRVEE